MSETSKDAVMQSMFGVFNKPASETKFKKEDDASGGVMFKPDPKNSPNQVFRGVVKFLPNLHDMENMTVTKTTYWVPEGAQGGFTYDSPKSIGKYEKCIVADKYWELSGSDDARLKALAKKINYSKKTYALVQVVKDLGKPENDGKIMLWDLPVAIQKKIDSIMYPSKEDIDMGAVANNIFDPMLGFAMTLKIGIKTVANPNGSTSEYRDYDDCKFEEKLPTTMVVTGEKTQLKLSADESELLKQQESMLNTILAGPNLQDYAFKAPTEDVLNRVRKAFVELTGSEPVAETPAQVAQPVAETPAQVAQPVNGNAVANSTTDEDAELLASLGLSND